jgi:hypothetical protein
MSKMIHRLHMPSDRGGSARQADSPMHMRLPSVNRNIVEGDATRGTTTLVYLQLHISLYTGTVHVLSRVAGIRPLV